MSSLGSLALPLVGALDFLIIRLAIVPYVRLYKMARLLLEENTVCMGVVTKVTRISTDEESEEYAHNITADYVLNDIEYEATVYLPYYDWPPRKGDSIAIHYRKSNPMEAMLFPQKQARYLKGYIGWLVIICIGITAVAIGIAWSEI